MDKVKVAVIGCGNISRGHINGYLADKRAEIVYCVDINEDIAKEKAQVAGSKWHTNYLEILGEVDAVDICTPPHLHAEMAIEAAKRGKHILTEKIMARNLTEAEAMIKATDEAGVIFMVALVLRYRPEFEACHEVCTNGQLGQILQSYMQTSMFLSRVASWRADPEKFPMGAFLSHGCHYVDQLIWNVGEITQVASFSSNSILGNQIIGDDTSVAIFRHENGAVSSYVESWVIRYPLTTILFDVYGTEGSIRLSYSGGKRIVTLTTSGGTETIFEFDPSIQEHIDAFGGVKDMQGEISHFIDCIVENKRPLTDGRESLKSMQVIIAASEAEATKKIVDMKDFL